MKFNPSDLGKTIRLFTKLVVSYINANRKLFSLVVIASFGAIFFFPQISAILFKPKPVSVGYVGNYTPSTLPRFIQDKISFGLTRLTTDDQATTGAAISWEATESGKVVTFHLDPNLNWHDGQKFNSSQLEYNLKGVDVAKPDGLSIKLTLKESFAPLTVLLSQPIFKNGLVGLGENKVVSIKFNGRFISSLELQNLKTSQDVVYKFYPSEDILLTAFKLGSIDSAQGLKLPPSTDLAQKYRTESNIEGNTEAMIFFNTAKKPFDDKTIRQGLSYALPEVFPYGETTDSPMPKNSWAFSSASKKYTQSIATAEKFLGDTGTDSAGIKVNLLVTRGLEPIAATIADAWNKVGVNTSVIVGDTVPLNFDAYLTYVDLPFDPDQYMLWHSTQSTNISGYKSPKVDKLLEEGRQTLDPADRKDIYASFQKAITEDVPAIFLFYPKIYSLSKH